MLRMPRTKTNSRGLALGSRLARDYSQKPFDASACKCTESLLSQGKQKCKTQEDCLHRLELALDRLHNFRRKTRMGYTPDAIYQEWEDTIIAAGCNRNIRFVQMLSREPQFYDYDNSNLDRLFEFTGLLAKRALAKGKMKGMCEMLQDIKSQQKTEKRNNHE